MLEITATVKFPSIKSAKNCKKVGKTRVIPSQKFIIPAAWVKLSLHPFVKYACITKNTRCTNSSGNTGATIIMPRTATKQKNVIKQTHTE